jgi:hypothetical protein
MMRFVFAHEAGGRHNHSGKVNVFASVRNEKIRKWGRENLKFQALFSGAFGVDALKLFNAY